MELTKPQVYSLINDPIPSLLHTGYTIDWSDIKLNPASLKQPHRHHPTSIAFGHNRIFGRTGNLILPWCSPEKWYRSRRYFAPLPRFHNWSTRWLSSRFGCKRPTIHWRFAKKTWSDRWIEPWWLTDSETWFRTTSNKIIKVFAGKNQRN